MNINAIEHKIKPVWEIEGEYAKLWLQIIPFWSCWVSIAKTRKLLPQEVQGPSKNVFTDIWMVKGGSKISLPIPIGITKTMKTGYHESENQQG